VLVGYSQGAMLMHRLFLDLITAGKQNIVNRIDGVVLLADGDRLPGDGITHWESAGANPLEGLSWAWPGLSFNRKLRLGNARPTVHSVCVSKDTVCNPSKLLWEWKPKGTDIHTSYSYWVTRTTQAVAATVAQRVRQRVPMTSPLPGAGACLRVIGGFPTYLRWDGRTGTTPSLGYYLDSGCQVPYLTVEKVPTIFSADVLLPNAWSIAMDDCMATFPDPPLGAGWQVSHVASKIAVPNSIPTNLWECTIG
jgi:hypothetical protein